MADLEQEYTDRKGRTHTVEHLIVPAEDADGRERLVEELFHVLTKPDKGIPM